MTARCRGWHSVPAWLVGGSFPRVEQLPQTVPIDLSLCRSIVYVPGTYGLTSVPIVFWMVALSVERRITLHRRALWIEYVTVGWNVVEAVVAIGAGVIAGSVALIWFGADSAIEVISAAGLLWRLRKAGPHATVSEEGAAEKRALYVVALTFFLRAIYITWEAVKSLISREEPLTSPVGSILAVLSLAVMPTRLRQAAEICADRCWALLPAVCPTLARRATAVRHRRSVLPFSGWGRR
jgi:hypothetical protein